ncbi:hypothetical protein CC1G_02222 [Coprinopsis cinerea okayama7|uniref:MARVEL domain-containing protein n=1 Tax=Coprinopsis cinerea (strain Okayama-7 / 130 / ATCC MYA-4618 / FGSC 9003) TaxID=240176 RepID=A8NKL7_COPC7|nr:hypothetical protein CC1G_02222 [Coprinopsis cinerea okayama7\|eukprot:XP_001834486.1 hypothetical protein CC1G_02222 [Coprinopsis cinerea okayama7\
MVSLKDKLDLPNIRMGLYAAFAVFSFFVFVFCCARLNYTTTLHSSDPLNGGRTFHDPVVAELLFTTLIAMPWSGFMIYTILKRYENRYVSKFREELIILGLIWLFWMVGTGIATSMWGSLGWCQHINACRVLTALVAFCWLGWLALTGLVGLTLLFVIANKAWLEPSHGKWDPRQTVYKA